MGGAVIAAAEPVGVEVLVDSVRLGQDMPDHDDEGVGADEYGLVLGSFAEAALEAAELSPK